MSLTEKTEFNIGAICCIDMRALIDFSITDAGAKF